MIAEDGSFNVRRFFLSPTGEPVSILEYAARIAERKKARVMYFAEGSSAIINKPNDAAYVDPKAEFYDFPLPSARPG